MCICWGKGPVHNFPHGVELAVAVSWKGNKPNPLSQTPPIPMPLKPGAPWAVFCLEVQLHLGWSLERQPVG